MADQVGGIQIIVTPNCPVGNVGSQVETSPESAPCLLDPNAGVGECGRSIISNASSNISYQQRQRRAQWRGIGSSCMWNAFRASLIGLFLFVSGCVVVLVGNYKQKRDINTFLTSLFVAFKSSLVCSVFNGSASDFDPRFNWKFQSRRLHISFALNDTRRKTKYR